jgi:hypothetical protein
MKKTFAFKLERRLRMTASSAALWSPEKIAYRFGLRSSEDLALPDFLGIGVQKAGTTWLWANLRCHPELFLPPKKELHFFNFHFYNSLAGYASQFEKGKGKVRGEITPAYAILSKQKIAFIKKVMPSTKLILILRNPIDRAWSRARMVLKGANAKEIDLTRFSEKEIRRSLAHRSSRARGDYLSTIDNWLEYFPEKNLYICFYDDLSLRPKKFLMGIFNFLGVRSDVDWNGFPHAKTLGRGAKATIPDKYRQILEEMYCSSIEELYKRFGAQVENWRCS